MALVEVIRLILVLTFTAAGYQFGKLAPAALNLNLEAEPSLLVFSIVGAGIGYVVGGMVGRSLLSAVGAVERKVDRISGSEIVAGAIGIMTGALASLFAAWPLIVLAPAWVAFPVVALIFIFFAYMGYRLAARKHFEILSMMGLMQQRSFRDPSGSGVSGPRILDASAIIDGRIIDVARSGFLSGHVVCPQFILAEIQSIADSSEALRRARGRRGLEILDALQSDARIQLEIIDDQVPEYADVDAKLVALGKRLNGVLVTTDFNLHRVSELQGVPVLNLNTLAASLRPAVIPGEEISVRIIREGSQKGQGVGYLDDGTMVVVESAADQVGRDIGVTITSVLQTAAGRMLFGASIEEGAPSRND